MAASAVALLLLLVAAAAVASPRAALAASGGSMGGFSDSGSVSVDSSFGSTTSYYDSFSRFSSSSSSSPRNTTHGGGGSLHPPEAPLWVRVAFFSACLLTMLAWCLRAMQPTTVVKLQVAVWGVAAARSFQSDLNKIADKVKASNQRWYKFMLTETISSLRRHKDFCISSSLSVEVKEKSEDSWKDHFKKISEEERNKFDEETLSNLEGVKKRKIYSKKTDGSKNEYIVLTILVAVDGKMELPEAINSAADLEVAVANLNSTPETDLQGVHVLWTPQDEDDVLSEERLLYDYSYLKPLRMTYMQTLPYHET